MQFRQGSITSNTKGFSKHEHTVSNCEFFIKPGKIYILQSTQTWLTLFCPRVKLNALQKSTSSIVQHIFDHFPLYHKTETRHALIVDTFHALIRIKRFMPLTMYIYIYIYDVTDYTPYNYTNHE